MDYTNAETSFEAEDFNQISADGVLEPDLMAIATGPTLRPMDWLAYLDIDTLNNLNTTGISSDSRVCERCIRKKVKCDRERPACSRCIQSQHTCVYSTMKKKPGPVKGSKRRIAGDAEDPTSQGDGRLAPVRTTFSNLQASVASQTSASELHSEYLLQTQAEQELVHDFFDRIHPFLHVFDKDRFLPKYHSGLVAEKLVRTICAVTASILQPHPSWSDAHLSLHMDFLLRQDLIDENLSTAPHLSTWQEACLLACYGFHQTPSRLAWMRICRLTRQACLYGLHQLDAGTTSAVQASAPHSSELEDWRYVWWSIYSLDTYANVTNSSPCVIDIDSIDTAFLSSSTIPLTKLQLPGTEQFLQMFQEVLINGCNLHRNIQIITEALLREAATAHRLCCSKPPLNRLHQRRASLSNAIIKVRLALPQRFTRASRDVANNETPLAHCSRLVCLFHLQAAKMFVSLPPYANRPGCGWTPLLESCDEIVDLVRHWDVRYSSNVDPAICFIACGACVLMNVYRKTCPDLSWTMEKSLQDSTRFLVLFLEHFENMWKVPTILLSPYNPLQPNRITCGAD